MSRSRLGDEYVQSPGRVQNIISKLWVSGVEHAPSRHVNALVGLLALGRSLMVGSWMKAREGKVVEVERHVGERTDKAKDLGFCFTRTRGH